MPTLRAAHRVASNLFIVTLLLSSIIVSILTVQPVLANVVQISPGNSDLRLGNSTSLVELSYPNSGILTNSIGDLLFTVTLEPNSSQFHCDVETPTPGRSPLESGDCQFSLSIYIPPEFAGLSIANTWTSFTNNYDPHLLRLTRLSPSDQIAPNWWQVSVNNLNVTCTPWFANPARGVFLAYPTCSPTNPPSLGMSFATKPQYIRLLQVKSPTEAGRYFFKAFINSQSIGADNFPTLVVKASRDPATISGTLRDLGDRNPDRAGQPIFLAPGTGAQIIATGHDPLGRSVSAQTFINSTADGSYTLFGVAAGTYNITAYAAGYIPTTITQLSYPYTFFPEVIKPTPITVAPAQSLEGINIYLSESPNVTGTVLSETASGIPVEWGTVCSISFGFSPPPICTTPRAITIQLVGLDGTTVVGTNQQPFAFTAVTSPIATNYLFSIQNELSSWNGEIPQNFADFTSGLPSGEDYFVRAYVTSYIQLAEARVHIANSTVDTEAPIPLIRTGIFNVTVHFKDSNFTGSDLVDDPIKVNGTLSVSAYDMEGILRAQNSTSVLDGSGQATMELLGISSARQRGVASQFSQNYGIPPGTYYLEARFTAAPPVVGNAATTTNAPVPSALVVGDLYYQIQIVLATIGLGEGVVEVSFPIFRAAGIQLHIYSIDTELPPVYRDWAFPGSTVLLTFIPTGETSLYQTNSTQPAGSFSIPEFLTPTSVTLPGLNVTGLQSGTYDMFVSTLGYTQQTPLHFTVRLGTNADASVWMVVNPIVSLTVAFRHEGLLTGINSTEPYAQPINNLPGTPTRVEVFDSLGNFVAANASYIPNNSSSGTPTTVANFTLAGFNIYYGDPRYVWSGFYDTTDQVNQQAGGLLVYPWELSQPYHEFRIRIWVDGYYQEEPLQVTVPTRGNVSVVIGLDRASRIGGTVLGPDLFYTARPLSWATVDLEPSNYSLSGIIDVRPGNYTTSSLDGSFQVWMPQGRYGMGVSLEGYATNQAIVAAPEGSDMNMSIWLQNYQLAASADLAASVNVHALPVDIMLQSVDSKFR